MKKSKILLPLALSLMVIPAFALTSCDSGQVSSNPNIDSSSNINSDSIDPDAPVIISKLKIKSLPTKLKYAVGEKFDSTGLKVLLLTTSNGEVIKEEETTDYTLSIPDGTILSEGEFEIIVKSNKDKVRSTEFNIVVEVDVKLAPLFDIIDQMVKTNNYTVNNTLGGTNHIQGLMNKDALYWTSDEQAYFMDEGWGYGTLNDKTYRFKIENDTFVDAIYLKDTGFKAVDDGLFSIDTMDELADRRISNYSIQNITETELNYLKNDCKPVENNPNRYQISLSHCKWLFNTIAHTQLTINPYFFLSSGGTQGKIYIEVKDYGLDIDLITADTFDGVKGCVAKITNIGTTIIPGLKEFKANPTFGKQQSLLDKLNKGLNNKNYTLTSEQENDIIKFTNDYVYGANFNNVDGVNHNIINVKENNKLNKEPGVYNLNIQNNEVSLSNDIVNVNNISYLTDLNLFKNMNQYFKLDPNMMNKYVYNVKENDNSNVKEFVKIFVKDYDGTSKLTSVNLDAIMAGNEIYQISIEVNINETSLTPIVLNNFNNSSNALIDNFIKNTLY